MFTILTVVWYSTVIRTLSVGRKNTLLSSDLNLIRKDMSILLGTFVWTTLYVFLIMFQSLNFALHQVFIFTRTHSPKQLYFPRKCLCVKSDLSGRQIKNIYLPLDRPIWCLHRVGDFNMIIWFQRMAQYPFWT